MGRKAKITERHRTVAKALVCGVPATQAFVEAGYSEATARKGTANLKERIPALAQALHEETMNAARKFIAEKNPSLSKVEIEKIVEGVLVRNALKGEGKAKGSSYAAKLLGSLSRVNLFEPDISVGVLAMQVPEEWKDRYSLEEAGAKQQPVDPLPPAEQKYLHGVPVCTTEDASKNVERQKALTESPATPPQESKQATIGDADTPALPPAPEPTGEPQQET